MVKRRIDMHNRENGLNKSTHKIVIFLIITFVIILFLQSCLKQAGDGGSTIFLNTFLIEENPSPGTNRAHSIAVNGNFLYVAGSDEVLGDQQWRVEKRDIDTGQLVPDFDTDGVVESNPSMSSDLSVSIAVDANYIYIAGSDSSLSNEQWRVEKRDLTSGQLVTASRIISTSWDSTIQIAIFNGILKSVT
jgi:hypothetical protein